MKRAHVEQVAVFLELEPRARVRVGRLARAQRRILFEYDAAFLGSRLELSPRRLPLAPGVHARDPRVLDGLMGVFDDSLPDGWGRLLIDRRATELGLSGAELSPLDRLALVGHRAMGALVYEPEIAFEDPAMATLAELARETEIVFDGERGADLERLIAVGGSPKGARPKALIQLSPGGEVRFGARTIDPGFTAWLVKFRAREDDRHIAALEHAYFLMASAAGIDVPRTRVLGRTPRDPGYFAIERFDRTGTARHHMHTLGGLLDLPHGYPAYDYVELLMLARDLTRDESAVAELFRRACFNVLAHNRDDHTRNFAFLMSPRGEWRTSPAYDLTFSSGPGGEHTMLVAGEGRAPNREHLLEVARRGGVRRPLSILDEVRAAVDRFARFADEAGVPARLRNIVAIALGVPTRSSASRTSGAPRTSRPGSGKAPRRARARSATSRR